MIFHKSKVKELYTLLGVVFDPSHQDWDHELADKERINEFIDKYKRQENELIKLMLMHVIVSSINDLLYNKKMPKLYLEFLEEEFLNNQEAFKYLIEMWPYDYNSKDNFLISPVLEYLKVRAEVNQLID